MVAMVRGNKGVGESKRDWDECEHDGFSDTSYSILGNEKRHPLLVAFGVLGVYLGAQIFSDKLGWCQDFRLFYYHFSKVFVAGNQHINVFGYSGI